MQLSLAVELADNEAKHIVALQAQLGSAAIPMPQVNIGKFSMHAAPAHCKHARRLDALAA